MLGAPHCNYGKSACLMGKSTISTGPIANFLSSQRLERLIRNGGNLVVSWWYCGWKLRNPTNFGWLTHYKKIGLSHYLYGFSPSINWDQRISETSTVGLIAKLECLAGPQQQGHPHLSGKITSEAATEIQWALGLKLVCLRGVSSKDRCEETGRFLFVDPGVNSEQVGHGSTRAGLVCFSAENDPSIRWRSTISLLTRCWSIGLVWVWVKICQSRVPR